MSDTDAVHEAGPIGDVLRLGPTNMQSLQRERLSRAGVVQAVAEARTTPLFDWLVSGFALQGISDHAALSYQAAHGQIAWAAVQADLRAAPCPRLRSWWHFKCGYRKSSRTCAEPGWLEFCGLPKHDLRKGVLNEAAFGLALFIRDICDGDLVTWIDQRLAAFDDDHAAAPAHRRRMASALIKPLSEIPGTGPKLWSMLLADLLLAADPNRERWVATGASMIAVDTLVHAWLHRTGMLRRYDADHPYGAACYAANGCVGVIERLAETIDARAYNSDFPAYFPRFIQVAIWEFCAEGGRNICNGRKIDDRAGCNQVFCPAGESCGRIALRTAHRPVTQKV